jgi:carbamoyl-phosphate synthase large subunit
MPKRTDIKSIMIIGSGPIVIGQACEFDYSGTQACKALKEEGYRVILINSNPATIMTDPGAADAVYIEPLTPEFAEKVIAAERPDAVLPTVGGQTALNITVKLAEKGVFEKYNVEVIGASIEAIHRAEDREIFRRIMDENNLPMPAGNFAHNMQEAEEHIKITGFPAIVRPSFTLGGAGGGIAYNIEEYRELANRGLNASMISEILVEESITGWKEFELEVIRDKADNVIIICSIENIDPMGVHTGDSVTVAPAQTLSDAEYQQMRDWAKKVIRAIGVETGGSNVQFAVNPNDGRMTVIEMNPRVSRSSALASKATGFPIAKIAAKLAVGYTLDELPNDITKVTPASFEPTLDYVVVKIPRWEFERFPEANRVLGTQMKSIGETMAIGRTFKEAFLKGYRSLENGRHGLETEPKDKLRPSNLRGQLIQPNAERFFHIWEALKSGWNVIEVQRLTQIDTWFILQINELVDFENSLAGLSLDSLPQDKFKKAKRFGFSDRSLANMLGSSEADVRAKRLENGLKPVYKRVDTCAAEYEAFTPYMYSSYDQEDESEVTDRKKVIILGGGPNRIGQAIEFDFCCCQASYALAEADVESIIVNCNPETVSTDYDTSDRLYFEPLTFENVLDICENEKPDGIVVQFGGQTPLKLANRLAEAGVPILGTSPEGIDLAEDRGRFGELVAGLGLEVPKWRVVNSEDEAISGAKEIGYPVLIRPSYVLGGAAMAIVYNNEEMLKYLSRAADISPDTPVFIDKFLEDAFEIDVDALCDGKNTVIVGILQHIEEAGIHSGDSSMVLPTYKIAEEKLDEIREVTRKLAMALGVIGLMNVQYAIKGEKLYIIEANPRASRTIPFISKAIGKPLAKMAMHVMLGSTLEEIGFTEEPVLEQMHVKASVFPFGSFHGEDPLLGPQMRSTGEVMGRAPSFGAAFAKAMIGAGINMPTSGSAFISVNDNDKKVIADLARQLQKLGFKIYATSGTGEALVNAGVETHALFKISEGRPNVLDAIKNGEINLIINTPLGRTSFADDSFIRTEALSRNITCLTTLSAAEAAIEGIAYMQEGSLEVEPL